MGSSPSSYRTHRMQRFRLLYGITALTAIISAVFLILPHENSADPRLAAGPSTDRANTPHPPAPDLPFQRRQEERNETVTYPFVYAPPTKTTTDHAGPEQREGRLIFPERLQRLTSPFIHVYLFIAETLQQETDALPYLRHALEATADSKNIAIITITMDPSERSVASPYYDGLRALRTFLPTAAITDTVIARKGGAPCQPDDLLRGISALPPTNTLGLILYDGCMGESITPDTILNPEGIALYLNPDLVGMGKEDPKTVAGNERRHELIRRLWQFGSVPKPCPPCASSLDAKARCFGQTPDFGSRDGSTLISIETSLGHMQSMEIMTDIAFCAFYR